MLKVKSFKVRLLTSLMLVLAFNLIPSTLAPQYALAKPEVNETSDNQKSDFGLEEDNKSNANDRKEIAEALAAVEKNWNAHNLEAFMGSYADDYVSNDGFDKKTVEALTKEFWDIYPDARSTSKIKQIRINMPYATVESRDLAFGTTANEMKGLGSKGELQAVSEGQLYLKKQGPVWRIIGDRIDYEKVRLSWGLARQVDLDFAAPELVKAGKQYSAKVDLNLPVGLSALGSITSIPVTYPWSKPTRVWKPVDGSSLERMFYANLNNKNELLDAEIAITNSTKTSCMGMASISRRVNVVPLSESTDKTEIAAEPKKSDEEESSK